jgi:hypothetical protein
VLPAKNKEGYTHEGMVFTEFLEISQETKFFSRHERDNIIEGNTLNPIGAYTAVGTLTTMNWLPQMVIGAI